MTLTLQEQKQILNLINRYNSTDRDLLQNRLIRFIDDSGYKNKAIAEKIGVSIDAVYGWRKTEKFNRPSFETAVKLMDFLNLPITDLIK